MTGPQSDAGIKVYLYEPIEEAFINNLGFAVAPGQHALVGVKVTEVGPTCIA